VLTSVGKSSTTALWTGGTDSFSRIGTETNTVAEREGYGQVNGLASLTAFLDGNPMPITTIGTNASQWRAELELFPRRSPIGGERAASERNIHGVGH
jgi:hypothetical protein